MGNITNPKYRAFFVGFFILLTILGVFDVVDSVKRRMQGAPWTLDAISSLIIGALFIVWGLLFLLLLYLKKRAVTNQV